MKMKSKKKKFANKITLQRKYTEIIYIWNERAHKKKRARDMEN